MKRTIVVLVLAMVIAMTGTAMGSNGPAHQPIPRTCTVQAFRPFSKAVWNPAKWKRGNPPQNVLEALRRRLACAPTGHKAAMKKTWEQDRATFFEKRKKMVWLETYKPFVYPDGKRWAVPYPIAWCESGGSYFIGPYGAYGLIMEPPYQAPREQDEDAHALYAAYGESPWAPYEGGCAYR